MDILPRTTDMAKWPRNREHQRSGPRGSGAI